MSLWGSNDAPETDAPAVVDTPSPGAASPGGSWPCATCGALVVSPPHVECQVCGTQYAPASED